jgi:hypothetical protein
VETVTTPICLIFRSLLRAPIKTVGALCTSPGQALLTAGGQAVWTPREWVLLESRVGARRVAFLQGP